MCKIHHYLFLIIVFCFGTSLLFAQNSPKEIEIKYFDNGKKAKEVRYDKKGKVIQEIKYHKGTGNIVTNENRLKALYILDTLKVINDVKKYVSNIFDLYENQQYDTAIFQIDNYFRRGDGYLYDATTSNPNDKKTALYIMLLEIFAQCCKDAAAEEKYRQILEVISMIKKGRTYTFANGMFDESSFRDDYYKAYSIGYDERATYIFEQNIKKYKEDVGVSIFYLRIICLQAEIYTKKKLYTQAEELLLGIFDYTEKELDKKLSDEEFYPKGYRGAINGIPDEFGYFDAIYGLENLYKLQKDETKLEQIYTRVATFLKKMADEGLNISHKHIEIYIYLNAKATILLKKQKKYEEAKILLGIIINQAPIEIFANYQGERLFAGYKLRLLYISIYQNMAEILQMEGKYEAIATLHTLSLNYYLDALAFYSVNRGEMIEDEKIYSSNLDEVIAAQSYGISENDKERFVAENEHIINRFYSYFTDFIDAESSHSALTKLAQEAIYFQTQTKGTLLRQQEILKKVIPRTEDKEISNNKEINFYYNKLKKVKKIISDYHNRVGNDTIGVEGLHILNVHKDNLEAKISSYFPSLYLSYDSVSYKDIQTKLKDDEAVVGMVRFQYKNFNKNQDSIRYLAMILTKKDIMPIVLKNGTEIENKGFEVYRRLMKQTFNKPANIVAQDYAFLYNIFWKEIAEKLSKFKNIYFCPDGVYHLINLNTIKNPATGNYLLDELNIKTITNLREIVVNTSNNKTLEKNAVLLGRPAYKTPEADLIEMNKNSSKIVRGDKPVKAVKASEIQWSDLYGTELEVTEIDTILKNSSWNTSILLGKYALESKIKSLNSPSILHIATHGYFFSSQVIDEYDALLNSGIVLAGVNDIKPYLDSENGVLTAYEASELNLQNTELVVLSACETGLGSLFTGEGVYGLQRGFKIAGAKSIMVSLWKVDDEATQKLMTEFYRNWLAGKSKRQAFKEAQNSLKEKYKQPYYWGAFVMIGE